MTGSTQKNADSVVVLDFETTGLSPTQGDRAIEIGAVKLERGQIIDRYQCLMNPGVPVSDFIEDYTGITNQMLESARPCEQVMAEFSDFIGNANLVAHNASFDQRFLDAECALIQRAYTGGFACSMLIARRIYPQAPNHKLGTLVEYRDLPTDGTFHRALADAEMTAYLWNDLLEDIRERFEVNPIPFTAMQMLSRTPKNRIAEVFSAR